ncbi:MAG TPA: hypothetical protein VK752_03775 [Bryobacteraceae bacterium]|jgi:hypothetical protein|nr:hypothetical protein [Bryobacteraceae bacterium]
MFWPRLKTIEQTEDQTILQEPPVYVACVIPLIISLLPVAIWAESPGVRRVGALAFVIAFCAFAMFFAVGMASLVTSTFYISRARGTLMVKRKLLGWTRENEYSANDVLTVYEDRSIKGNRLMMRMRSGQVKPLTIYQVYAPLDGQAGMLNSLLHEARQSRTQSTGLNPLID